MEVPLGLLQSIMLLIKGKITSQMKYVDLIINHLNKGGLMVFNRV